MLSGQKMDEYCKGIFFFHFQTFSVFVNRKKRKGKGMERVDEKRGN